MAVIEIISLISPIVEIGLIPILLLLFIKFFFDKDKHREKQLDELHSQFEKREELLHQESAKREEQLNSVVALENKSFPDKGGSNG